MSPPPNSTTAKPAPSALATLPPVCAGAVVVAGIMYPVDVCRALVMSAPGTSAGDAIGGFLKEHGMKGFLQKGMGAELTRGTISRAVKFFFQPIFHQGVFGKPEKQGNPITKGLAGVLATVPEVVMISPVENMKLAEQLDKEKKFNGMGSVAKHLLKTRGVAGLYIGYAGMQSRQALWTGGFFATSDLMAGVSSNIFGPGKVATICGGFLAGMFGVCINCWTDVTRTIIQKQAIASTFENPTSCPQMTGTWKHNIDLGGFVNTARGIAAEKGFMTGLYAGVHVKAVHLGGGGALLALFMPMFKQMWGVE